MRPIRVSFVVLLLGSLVSIALATDPGPRIRPSPTSWLKPWEAPKDQPPGKPVDAPCTCDDIRKRLDEAERMRDAYARAYREESFWYKSTLNSYIEKQMGWNEGSATPQAKPDDATTTPEERKQARANCKYCAWICDVALKRVHEGYHQWYTKQYEGAVFTAQVLSDLGHFNQRSFVKSLEISEMGAHQAEATFLRETLAEMERRGLCQGVAGTPTMNERVARWKEADEEVKFHLGLKITGSPL